ncbi:Ppx/GppA family phosphatase [Pseudomonas sp. BN414]|uniref:Ppx/GppA phosphatase family protein n=1 Tax=Pseudomonas sp. BN414 TaxID=2567888 RepID=UPI0024546534|nr:Ppx/GppA family phosphatase [Pseudomonas sp. BN414]MDH4567657.1 Ppx/GppA family phosphatase [Pseudomonas sp. BN414]
MTTIIPRWEWRTFGRRFGIAETRFAGLQPTAVQDSDELYLLAGSADNVKIRDALMDIKVLREVAPNGLERWEPVMKQGFPLAAADMRNVIAALNLPASPLERDAYTLDQFLAELVVPSGALRPLTVHKHRVRYKVGGCTAEVTEITAEGKATRSIAIESEDAAAVIAAVASVGLADYCNMSYTRGLRALLDAAPERYAVIDAGTNSIKFHIAERAADGSMRTVVDRAEMTRLGEGLEERGEIGHDAIERTVRAIEQMVEEAKQNGVLAIAAVGTAGLRMARNGAAVIATIRARTGVAIEVISGEEEGRLAYLAVKAGLDLPEGSLVVFDTGGGSSQFTFGRGARVDERFSVDVGAVRYTERFGLDNVVSPEVLGDALAAIAADLARIEGRPAPDLLVAMGGAITNLAAVKHALKTYDPDIVQGTVLDRAEIDRQIELYRSRSAAERRTIVGLQPKRADVILAGACIVRTVMDKLRQNALRVSDRGLRHGLLVERFGN